MTSDGMAAVITAAHCVVASAGYALISIEVLVGAYEFPVDPRGFGTDPGTEGSHYESATAADHIQIYYPNQSIPVREHIQPEIRHCRGETPKRHSGQGCSVLPTIGESLDKHYH